MSWDMDEYPQEAEADHEVTLNAAVSIQWNNDAVIQQVISKVADMVYSDIKPKAEKAVLASLDAQVNQAVSEMLDNEIQPADRWGKPVGTKVSIRALLQREAEEWLVENVDYKGRKGSDSYGQKNPRIHWVIQDALNGPADNRRKTHLQQMVIDAAKSVIGDVNAVVEAEIRKQAQKALGLKAG